MSTLPRKRRSREEWQRLVKEQQASDLNQTAFCEQHAIGLASFGQWKRRFQREMPSVDASWLELPMVGSDHSA